MHISSILIAASCLIMSFAHPGDTNHEAQEFQRQSSTSTPLEQWIPDHKRSTNADHETPLEGSQRKARRLASRAAGRGFGPPPNDGRRRKQPKQPESREARIARENKKISDLLRDPNFRARMIPCLELNVVGDRVRLTWAVFE